MENSPTARLDALLECQRSAFALEMNPTVAVRKERLARLAAMGEKHAAQIVEAISADFGHRSPHETQMAELVMVGGTIRHAERHLKGWMKARRVPTALHYRPGSNRLMRQPLGVVGIVAPWNYPYQLALEPAVAAIAAGNRVMLKPSELAPRLSELLARMVAEFFAEDEMAVVTGDAQTGKSFTELPFDHLLFTGSTAVGRMVAQAAAKNLTPVTLELGGKSPAILDPSSDLATVAPRLAFGKLLNAGQTCIAPDYAFVPKDRIDAFVEQMQRTIARMYPRLADNPDYTSIVSDRHFARLQGLLEDARSKGARIVTINPAGETFDPARRKQPPVLVLGATPEMKLMQEEIFGPILPVLGYDRIEEAIAYINRHDRPLALYWFGSDGANRDKVLSQTISGGVTLNDCIWHFAQQNQPFGGVGASGTGCYHGEWGFRTFSKEKPVFDQPRLNGMFLMYPPFGKTFERMLALLRRIA
ncbi:MAG: aldehyde dehydrogenase [Betaproteobacteria bacterium RIFCSPLOWO2_12_FULL_64_23]|nr:MAG: aldehyde dehydrogenase [Betaproteobacteria bacterium RIFCSPLOWO2_12_FULL_64_23]